VILVTGATGFIGRALTPRLVEGGASVRCLIRPARRSPRLPKDVPVQVAIASLSDPKGVRAALVGVDTIIHLAGAEWHGQGGDVLAIDAGGTRALVELAKDAGVSRFIYVSHLGADRASAFPVLKAKGIAEEFIRQSGLNYTILRTSLLYGEEDVFVNAIAMVLRATPFFFFMPGDGTVKLQPLWVEDLVTCLEWSLDDLTTLNQTISLGGPEFFSFREIVQTVMRTIRTRRMIVPTRQPYLRWGAALLESLLPRSPLTTRWLDHLAVNRTTELVSVTRYFGLRPARFEQTIGYMRQKHWLGELRRFVVGEVA
jgi:NADH dehydrogenase